MWFLVRVGTWLAEPSTRSSRTTHWEVTGLVAPAVGSPAMEVRPVRSDEQEEVAEILLAAYRAVPGDHLAGGDAGKLADVASRSRGAEVRDWSPLPDVPLHAYRLELDGDATSESIPANGAAVRQGTGEPG